jgi:hypothetical protein
MRYYRYILSIINNNTRIYFRVLRRVDDFRCLCVRRAFRLDLDVVFLFFLLKTRDLPPLLPVPDPFKVKLIISWFKPGLALIA